MNNSSKSGLTDKFRPPATKVCRLCKKELPIKNFSVSFKGRHGYANECRSCKKEHEDQRAEERKERAKTFFDAKFFMLLLLLTASLSVVGQHTKTLEYPGKPIEARVIKGSGFWIDTIYRMKPDTVRAIILVTLSANGIAHARMGLW